MKMCFVVTLAALLLLSVGAQYVSYAETATQTVNLEMRDIDVRAAIEALFRGTGKNFAIDANVSGIVPSVSFKDVEFDKALQNLVKTNNLIYRKDGDIYIIQKKPEPNPVVSYTPTALSDVTITDQPQTSEVRIEKIPLNYTSASELLAIMSDSSRGYGGFGSGYGGYGMGMMGGGYGMGMGGYGGSYGGYGMGGMMGGYGGGGINMMGGGYGMGTGGYGGSYGGYGGYGGGSNYGGSYGGYSGYGGSGSRRSYRGY